MLHLHSVNLHILEGDTVDTLEHTDLGALHIPEVAVLEDDIMCHDLIVEAIHMNGEATLVAGDVLKRDMMEVWGIRTFLHAPIAELDTKDSQVALSYLHVTNVDIRHLTATL